MKRDLFVFAGQSNMMGASVLFPKKEVLLSRSFEYKHNPRRLGAPTGNFVSTVYPVGEFSYSDLEKAYAPAMTSENGASLLADYVQSTYFCPAMANFQSAEEKSVFPFPAFSEATAQNGATLAPLLAEQWEQAGYACAYTHIAKGGVTIAYYFTDEMAEEYARRIEKYNQENGTRYSALFTESQLMPGAADYFFEKCTDFLADSKTRFPDDNLDNKCFFWLQGEGDVHRSAVEYEIKMDILWDRLKKLGFTHFFCIRVDYFGDDRISEIMKAQENFTARHQDAYMLTRAASYFTYPGQNEQEWFVTPPDEEYRLCRDSFFGYSNQHINEKGFSVIAAHGVKNLYRVLIEKKEPILEEENIRALAKI